MFFFFFSIMCIFFTTLVLMRKKPLWIDNKDLDFYNNLIFYSIPFSFIAGIITFFLYNGDIKYFIPSVCLIFAFIISLWSDFKYRYVSKNLFRGLFFALLPTFLLYYYEHKEEFFIILIILITVSCGFFLPSVGGSDVRAMLLSIMVCSSLYSFNGVLLMMIVFGISVLFYSCIKALIMKKHGKIKVSYLTTVHTLSIPAVPFILGSALCVLYTGFLI